MKNQEKVAIQAMRNNCDLVSQMLKTIAHPERLMLLCHLSGGEHTVGDLEKLCGISQSRVSQYLARMKLEGFVSSKKRGVYVLYKISNPNIKKLIKALHNIFC